MRNIFRVVGAALAASVVVVAVAACPRPMTPPSVFSTNIRFLDLGGVERSGVTFVGANRSAQGCEFRLELDDPAMRPPNALGQIGGTPPLEEFTVADCSPPGFEATAGTNLRHLEQQTAYFWLFEARDYARRRLWLPSETPTRLSTVRLETTIAAADAFATSCFPRDRVGNACMRAWGSQNPHIYLLEGAVNARDIIHEFGHYAAGFVYGHMDPFTGFNPADCVPRSFHETIADVFATLFLHERQPGMSPVDAGDTATWAIACADDDHDSGKPLVQAVEQLLWGRNAANTIQIPWTTNEANGAVADALHTALTLNPGQRIPNLAHDMLNRLVTRHPHHADKFRDIFREHGFGMLPGEACQENGNCIACQNGACNLGRCDTAVPMCIPADGTGALDSPCTHDNHCTSAICDVVRRKCVLVRP